MSWFTVALRSVLPFVAEIAGNKNFQAAGEAAFRGISEKIVAAMNKPPEEQKVELKKLADTLDEKAPELVGAVAAGTPAAKLVDAAVMPPDSGGKQG